MSKLETVQKLCRIYKPIAKELRLAAADERFGEGLYQNDIINMALAKYLKIDLKSLLSTNTTEKDELRESELWYRGEVEEPEPEEPPDPETVEILVDAMENKGYTWFTLMASINDAPSRYHLYEKAVRKRVEEDGFTFVESNRTDNSAATETSQAAEA